MTGPEVAFIRVTWFEGHDVPMVEMWTRPDNACCDNPGSYGYWRVSQPHIPDEQEWLRLLGTARGQTFEPKVNP